MKQFPAVQIYLQDFLGSLSVQLMDASEVGCYWLMLLNLYNNGGELPNDAKALLTLCHGTAPSEKVLKKFYVDGDVLRHEKADKILKDRQEFSEKMQTAAQKRWGKPNEKRMPRHSQGNAEAMGRQCSSTSSSIKKINKKNPVFDDPIVQNVWKSLDDECTALGMQNDMNPVLFEKMYYEFQQKMTSVTKEIKACLFYHKEKGKKVVKTTLVRNWLVNSVKYAKEKYLKNQTAFKDRVHSQDSVRVEKRQQAPVFDELVEQPEEIY